ADVAVVGVYRVGRADVDAGGGGFMITALGAFALSLSSPTADESAADRSDSKKLLHCALRTPAGDLITSQLLGIKVDPNKPPFLVAYREGG
ncbi:hypothetical protein ABTB87_23155, partial [Acinetobacter baumannii]